MSSFISRRQFLHDFALASGVCGLGLTGLAHAAPRDAVPTLSGKQFNLTIGSQTVNFTGTERPATTVNNSLPAPILRWREGDTVTLNVTNTLPVDSSIHWHGIILPNAMDGVPGMTFAGIKPGETFRYQFPLNQSGTYWYHSHSGFQEQTGMYGAIVIEPKAAYPFHFDREYVLMLSDWSDEKPLDIYHTLKKKSHYYNFSERTAQDLWREIKAQGVEKTWAERAMWNDMRMSDRDISDVTGYTYTYLLNGQTPENRWQAPFKKGEKILLRLINAAAMTLFDFRIPDLKMTVVANDGQYVEPISVDEIRIGVAETYDVLVEPQSDRAYALFAQAIDRTGYALGNLSPDASLKADMPALDPQPVLTHADMGMGMMMGAGHHHHHHGHQMAKQQHAKTEYGAHVDMRADNPQYRLDDPGVGLRDNGREVLTYSQLRNLYPTHDPEPEREIELHLTGNMHRYMWSINGVKFADAEPLKLKYGERVRITLVNDTMMNHPIHLHGLWSDLETGDDSRLPRKHTVIVQPGAKISYRVTADAKGRWAYHCHLLYHMLGMFREVVVS